MNTDVLCNFCTTTHPCEATVYLWDGNSYCHTCVGSVCPELWDFARSHVVLEESAQFDKRSQWKNALRFEVLLVLGLGTMFTFSSDPQQEPIGVAFAFGLAAFICSIQAAIQLPMFLRRGRDMLPTVGVCDGRIWCHRAAGVAGRSRSMPLSEAKWRIGKSRQDSVLRNSFIQRQAVVLFILPLKGRFSFGSDRYACGWSDRMRSIWVGFLTLAKVQSAGR